VHAREDGHLNGKERGKYTSRVLATRCANVGVREGSRRKPQKALTDPEQDSQEFVKKMRAKGEKGIPMETSFGIRREMV